MSGILHTESAEPTDTRDLLQKLRSREVIASGSNIVVTVAHQDDELLAFAAAIMRIPDCSIVHVTDGAPRESKHWNGLPSKVAYAEIRNKELAEALKIAGHIGAREALAVPDQEAALYLVETTLRLVDLFLARGIRYAFTHAYEGGHADHDAVSFAVHAAKKILKQKGVELGIIEAPFYRTEESRVVTQSFVLDDATETVTIRLSEDEILRKKRMYATYESQALAFSDLSPSTTTEWLREAPDYDFATEPNSGQFSHIFADSGITPEKWHALTTDALRVLGLDRKE